MTCCRPNQTKREKYIIFDINKWKDDYMIFFSLNNHYGKRNSLINRVKNNRVILRRRRRSSKNKFVGCHSTQGNSFNNIFSCDFNDMSFQLLSRHIIEFRSRNICS